MLLKNRRRWRTCMLAAGVGLMTSLGAMSGVAEGVIISNVTHSTVLFNDNFEHGSFSPSVGMWSIVGPDVTVTSSTVSPDPGPGQGSFYAKLFRNSNQNGQGNLQAQLSSVQSVAGDVIELKMMVYIPNDGQDARAQLMIDNGDFNSARAWIRPDGNGNVEGVGPGLVVFGTGLTYTPNAWQEWDMRYAVGSSTFSATVNGVTANNLLSFTSGPVGFADLFNGVSSVSGSIFLDGVPEPCSAVIMGAVAGPFAVVLARRRGRDRHTVTA